jgi:hypothetical protein
MTPEEVMEKTVTVLETMCSKKRAEEVSDFIEKIGVENYLYCPASSKEEYHNCFEGGLAIHNLNVFEKLIALDDIYKSGIPEESLAVVALLHDIGKVLNTDLKPFYVAETEKWKLDRGQLYSIDDGSVYLTTHQRTMWLIGHFGLKLSAQEYQAIFLNDGQYLQENKAYANKECVLAKLLHMADSLACMEENKAKP